MDLLRAIANNLCDFVDPSTGFMKHLFNVIFYESQAVFYLQLFALICSFVVLGISVAIMTPMKRQYTLDKATYVREIAFFLVLFRALTAFFFQWKYSLYTATIYAFLAFAVIWYVVAIVRERQVGYVWICDKLKICRFKNRREAQHDVSSN